MVNTNLSLFKTLVLTHFRDEVNPTEEYIERIVNTIKSVPLLWGGGDIPAQYIKDLIIEVKEKYGVRMDPGHFLDNNDAEFIEWLNERTVDMDWYYWKRYKQLLVEQGLPRDIISMTEERIKNTLSRLGDPLLKSSWDRRGMVVGSVQSGKTANYIGLAAMAADSGYKVIIIIAGIHTNLRNQTQERVDKGLIGRDSSLLFGPKSNGKVGAQDHIVGVGHIDSSRYPTSFTNKYKDFDRGKVGFNEQLDPTRKEPVIFVIKKNPSTLLNLITWLRKNSQGSRHKIELPLLLIDDEADNASINIAYRKDEISRINGQIRELLGLFSKSSYVGYTATPFANIFIDPESVGDNDDLFPRDFIVSLEPPSNYLGPERIFLSQVDTNPWLREINDWEGFLDPRHKIDFEPCHLADSLRESIRYFLLVVAIRHVRGDDDKDNSMLINVSRFQGVQNKLKYRVEDYLDELRNAVTSYAHLPCEAWSDDATMKSIHKTFNSECGNLAEKWEDILKILPAVARLIKTKVINSRSPDRLEYRGPKTPPLSVIAIGGLSLSRGLTLEGLSVSYFLRNSIMYDTLMQMGRWFGYRPKYEDLCRVWMTDDAIGWYQHIAESTQELKDEFLRMEQNNMSPSKFGLCVRTNPDTLIITAVNKMGAASKSIRSISLDERFIETHTLHSAPNITDSNLLCFSDFYEGIASKSSKVISIQQHNGFWGSLIVDVDCSSVLSLISRFKVHPASTIAFGEPLQKYISKRLDGELKYWDVFIASKLGGRLVSNVFAGLDIGMQQRTIGKDLDNAYTVGSRQKVSGRGIEKVGLSEHQVEEIEKDAGSSSFSDKRYRQVKGRKPLLILHLLELQRKDNDSWTEGPMPAWSVSLPATALQERTEEYLVNPIWLQEMTEDESEFSMD